VIENKPGAGGSIAAEQVTSAPADGYTLLLASDAVFAINQALYAKLPYNPDDLAILGVAATQPNILLAWPGLGVGSVAELIAAAKALEPDMSLGFVAFPGTAFSSPYHYAIFMRGNTPLTSRLFKPVLVDAATARITDSRALPWYVTALLVSQPLHFGDYGGMPLKIVWALLDVITIVVLGSGLYLWLAARRRALPIEPELAEIDFSETAPAMRTQTIGQEAAR